MILQVPDILSNNNDIFESRCYRHTPVCNIVILYFYRFGQLHRFSHYVFDFKLKKKQTKNTHHNQNEKETDKQKERKQKNIRQTEKKI